MVQQLSLYSVIDDGSFDLLISTISKLSGRSPVIYSNYNYVAKPNPNYDIGKINAKNHFVEQTRIRLMKSIPLEKLQRNKDDEISYKICRNLTGDELPIEMDYLQAIKAKENGSKDPWCLSIWDIPSAGKDRKVCMQSMMESVISNTGGKQCSMEYFLKELGYVPEYQYLEIGTIFYMNNGISFKVFKIWDIEDGNKKVNLITEKGFLVKAFLDFAKSTDLDSINTGTNNLLKLKRDLKGYLELSIPDRKCMDSRIGHLSDY